MLWLCLLFLCSNARTFKVNLFPFPKATVPLVSWAYTPNEQLSLRSVFSDADAILTCDDLMAVWTLCVEIWPCHSICLSSEYIIGTKEPMAVWLGMWYKDLWAMIVLIMS